MHGVHRLTSRVLLFDSGETPHDGAMRELRETGLGMEDLGEPVYTHDFVVDWDDAEHDTGHAEFYTATVDAFDPSSSS